MSWERFQTFFIKMFYQCQKEEEREKRHFCKRSKEKKDILEEHSLASVLSSSCTTTSSHGQHGLSPETLAADLNGQCLPLSPSPGKSMTKKVWVCIRRSLPFSPPAPSYPCMEREQTFITALLCTDKVSSFIQSERDKLRPIHCWNKGGASVPVGLFTPASRWPLLWNRPLRSQLTPPIRSPGHDLDS